MKPLNKVIVNKDTSFNPIWIMRQAGRYLTEFREIRKDNPNFINLCLNDDLSSEITLQPLRRFDLDAAIIFSDILMLPYGLGQKVEFEKNFGPKLGKLNLFKGCRVIFEDKSSFKHKLIKLGFSFLISLNSGRYLPACLMIHIGLKEVSWLTITLSKGFINKHY